MLLSSNGQLWRGVRRVIASRPCFSADDASGRRETAKKFLRHPAIVCIGDEDSGKNKRIRQHVLFISEQQKKQALIDFLEESNRRRSTSCSVMKNEGATR